MTPKLSNIKFVLGYWNENPDSSNKKFKQFVYHNENMNAISNFKRNYLKNYNDSGVVVKTKNAPFFMNFPNI
jgi:hypothetical protein